MDQTKNAFLKSSVDPLVLLQGRPYGGIGLICQEKSGIFYSEIECDSDRISGLKVANTKGDILMIIFAIYLPYKDNSRDQYIRFGATLKVGGGHNASEASTRMRIAREEGDVTP